MKISLLPALALPLALAACGGGGTPTTIGLPVTVGGQVLAVQLAASQTSQTFQGATSFTTRPTSTQATDRTVGAAPTPLALNVSVSANPAGTTTRAVGNTQVVIDALADVTVTGSLDRGATFNNITGATGTSTFNRGNFGDNSARSDAATQISGFSIYRPGEATEIILNDVSLVLLNSFDSGANTGLFGVGFIGNPTATMPAAAGPIVYRAFLENGTTIYNSSGGVRFLGIRDRLTNLVPQALISADLTGGTVTMDLNNINLVGTNAANDATPVIVNQVVEGLVMSGTITGNTILGTDMRFVDVNDVTVGVPITAQVAGGFYGADAGEVAMVGILEGSMRLDDGTGGATREFVFSLMAGGTQ